MTILESWEDNNKHSYAIVEYSRHEQKRCGDKRYEVVWFDNENLDDPLCSFVGCVGWNTAHYGTPIEAQEYLIRCIVNQDENPGIWFEGLVA